MVAAHAAKHMNEDQALWLDRFFDMMWNGWLSPASPVLSNMGISKGLPVSCSGSYMPDSVDGIYSTKREIALMTKYGFGTSVYLGDIRPRGTPISAGGTSEGILPIIKGLVSDMQYVSQGSTRRGACGIYVPIEHGDFYEVCELLHTENDDLNIGWNITQSFLDRLKAGDEDSVGRFQEAMWIKCQTGKGYFWLVDKANAGLPQPYKDHGLSNKASNLCSEVRLPSDEEHTYTCVLSSLNLAKYDEWKDTDTIQHATVFLDCVASEFIEQAKDIKGLEKAVNFTSKFRALGLGVMGFHTYIQSKGWTYGSLDAMYFNKSVFKSLQEGSTTASKWMFDTMGSSPEMAAYGLRNASTIAIAPTMSTALIMGGVSQGIEPIAGNVFMQETAGGEVERVNPNLVKLLRETGRWDKKLLKSISDEKGSLQHIDCLTDEEKLLFATAFEIDQEVILRLANQRQVHIDQGQSLNLFVDANCPEELVAQLHRQAFESEHIIGLYYLRTQAGVKIKATCESCEG
jgi:ribonucleoside-diphosphate reductase alpha chain